MGLDDIKHKAEEMVGKGKQQVGDATGDENLEAEGARQETSGNVKQVGDKIKDVFKS